MRNRAHSKGKGVQVIATLVIALGLVLETSQGLAAEIWVVTDRQHHVIATPEVRIIELDAPARIQTELSANLPRNLKQATLIVQQRINAGGAELQRQLANAYQGVVDAWSVGVEKIPAVVVDRRYVVYGETNVAKAVTQIEKYRSEHP